MKDYYYILGVDSNATDEDIKTAYRKLSKKFHPDANNGEPFFEERFKAIQEAYETLSDPGKRSAYDLELRRFNLSRLNNDDLKEYEASLKKKYDEELKWREEALRQQYQQGQMDTGSGVFEPDNETRPTATETKQQNNAYAYIVGIVLVLMALAVIVFMVNKKKDPPKRADPINAASHTSSARTDTAYTPMAITAANSNAQVFSANNPRLVLRNNNTMLLGQFPLGPGNETEVVPNKTHRFVDLDNDSIPELLTSFYTGGIHCCDVNDVFVEQSEAVYKQVFSFTGGLQIKQDFIVLDFHEYIGYFYSCYTCYADSLPAPVYSEIRVQYVNGKFLLAPAEEEINRNVITNLEYLAQTPIPDVDDVNNDDGTRKAYARNIITWHFNNGADLNKTKALFDRYYDHYDKDTVWKKLKEKCKDLAKW
jgi:DnaJ-domain-containing protein 1